MSEGSRIEIRPPIAVMLSRFPRVTETFILREVIELERRGWPVTLVPLIRETVRKRGGVVHPEAVPWVGRALFTGWLSPAIAASNLRALGRRPIRWLATLGRLVLGNLQSPGFLAKSLALFPKAVHLAERLREAGIDHVHAHFATHPATVAWVVERLAGIPYSVTVHAHDIFVDRAFLEPKLRRARFVRTISDYNRRYLAERYPKAAGRLEVIHVGVDAARYRPAPGEARRREPGEPVRVLTVAALEVYKGIDLLIEVAAILRDRRLDAQRTPGEREKEGDRGDPVFDVVGEGYHRHDLEDSIARHGLEGVVRLVGAVPQAEVARRLAAADLFFLPSIVASDGQMEGIPVALMEALASELPVVATRLSGIPELVEDGVTGLLVDPRDWDGIADAIERLIRDPELGRRLGRAGRERVEAEFSLRSTVGELAARIGREVTAGDEGDAAALEAALAGAGLLGDGSESAAIGVRRRIETGDSRVAEVLVAAAAGAAEPRDVVVKIHRSRAGESAPPAERAARELALLRRLAEREQVGEHGALGVPRPLSPEPVPVAGEDGDGGPGAAIVLERARGERLDGLIRAHRLGRSEEPLATAFRRAGAWLRWFHRAARAVGGEPVVHGDFWPGNLFLSPDRVEGIDFEGARSSASGDPRDDAAYFLRHAVRYFVPRYSYWNARFTLLWPRWKVLERAFLDGFSGDGR